MHSSDTLQVLSYNIHKGFARGNKRFVLDSIRDAIRKADVDLVFLQEVLGEQNRHAERISNWPTESQFEFLADQVWHHYAYGKNAVYEEGHHGNAILSKYPILHWSNHTISTNYFEKRGYLHTLIDLLLPNGKLPLHAVCLHLGLTRAGRREQLARLCDRLTKEVPPDAPLVIAGDFNDWEMQASRIIESRLNATEAVRGLNKKYAATFPAVFPFFRLDRIYVRGFKVSEATTLTGSPWKDLSDHLPICATLKIGG